MNTPLRLPLAITSTSIAGWRSSKRTSRGKSHLTTKPGSALTTTPQVTDGQSTLRLEIGTLPAQAAITFTIDVDDTLGQREITVAGAEIAGATVTLIQGDTNTTARFSADATATLPQPDCPV